MADDPTEDAIRSEISAAVKILRDDGLHIHKTYEKYVASKTEKVDPPKEGDNPDAPKDGDPPPVKPEPTEKPKRKGIWWGDRE